MHAAVPGKTINLDLIEDARSSMPINSSPTLTWEIKLPQNSVESPYPKWASSRNIP